MGPCKKEKKVQKLGKCFTLHVLIFEVDFVRSGAFRLHIYSFPAYFSYMGVRRKALLFYFFIFLTILKFFTYQSKTVSKIKK